jgi:hypothetical protein
MNALPQPLRIKGSRESWTSPPILARRNESPTFRAEGKTRRVATNRILLIVLAMLLGLAGLAGADSLSEFNAGNAALNSGDLDMAIADYTKAIELYGNYPPGAV